MKAVIKSGPKGLCKGGIMGGVKHIAEPHYICNAAAWSWMLPQSPRLPM